MHRPTTILSPTSISRLLSIFIIVVPLTKSFKVTLDNPNKEFKVAIETSIHHPIVDVLNTDDNTNDNDLIPLGRSSKDDNMISVFDDTTFSPFTPTLDSIATYVSGKYQYIASSVSSAIQKSPKSFIPRKTFVADENPSEYWFHNKIHSFGNTGFLGAVHAACAPVATKLIDLVAYDKIDVRYVVSQELARIVHEKTNDNSNNKSNDNNNKNIAVLDLCCGIGMSTNALKDAFIKIKEGKDSNVMVIGVDTSPEMIETARGWTRHDIALGTIHKVVKKLSKETTKNINAGNMLFARGNAERTIFPDKSFNLVTIMYAFHEIPKIGRYRILREVRRILQNGGTLALIDISPDYTPSATMLAGEPYVLEYQRNIEKQMENVRGFINMRQEVIIPGHVNMWLLDRKVSSTK